MPEELKVLMPCPPSELYKAAHVEPIEADCLAFHIINESILEEQWIGITIDDPLLTENIDLDYRAGIPFLLEKGLIQIDPDESGDVIYPTRKLAELALNVQPCKNKEIENICQSLIKKI